MIDLFSSVARRSGLIAAASCVFSILAFGEALADTPADPAIAQQPGNRIAGTNEDISFSVTATGTPPLRFQWLFNGNGLAGETNSSLILTNLSLSQSGNYSVIVANDAGSITSSNAVLLVQTNIVRRLGTGRILQIGSKVGVPITFRSNGEERSVSFSMAYGTNYSNPVFVAADTNATTSVDTTQPGLVGVAITLPAGQTFPSGYRALGLLEFDLAADKTAVEGALAFSSTPIPIAAADLNARPLRISADVLPQYNLLTNPVFQFQSGLFEQKLVVSNPGATTMTNVNLLALNLGVDRASNAITFFNAQSSQILPYGDPVINVECECSCGLYWGATVDCDFGSYLGCAYLDCTIDYSITAVFLPFAQINDLQPGESRTMTAEFKVTDHSTVPHPAYVLYLADPFPIVPAINAQTVIGIDISRYVSNSFIVEFRTVLGNNYFVQYAETPEGLITGKTALPLVTGTGSRVQWIDNGPPKTISPPTNGLRFYRVLSDQK